MRRIKTEIYLHFVWAVRLREPLLVGHIEDLAHGAISAEAERLDCDVMALNGV